MSRLGEPYLGYCVENRASNRPFVGEADRDHCCVGPKQAHSVGVVLESYASSADIVSNDKIEVLTPHLCLGVGDEIVGLCGEADQCLAGGLTLAETRQNVGSGLEDQIECPVIFFDLVVDNLNWTKIGDSGRHHHDIGQGRSGDDCGAHFGGGLDRDEFYVGRRW